MDIKYIRLQNFKGFKAAKLELKPLTVILGPNSAGKSSFGQALVALSKSNADASKDVLSLAFDKEATVEFGGYADLVHQGGYGQPVVIELGLKSGVISYGFGKGNIKAGINELDLEYIKEINNLDYDKHQSLPESSTQIINTNLSDFIVVDIDKFRELNRKTRLEWSVHNSNIDSSYLFTFNGVVINTASKLTKTGVPVDKVIPGFRYKSDLLASILRDLSYLRPDRMKPQRSRDVHPTDTVPGIDDYGQGTDWFIHKNRDVEFDTFFFLPPSPDKDESKKILEKYSKLRPDKTKLVPALTKWLYELGLAKVLDVKLLDGERQIQLVATPIGQQHSRPLTDVGFGLSQVLPILAKGLSLEKGGLLVVEQPEAQLHPKPQAGLADFFCSMVKCTRNVIVETHSVELFHRLRLRAAMDDDLAAKIGVYFIDEPKNGVCCEPEPISLNEEDELEWPKGFLPEGIDKELEILAARLARTE
jgi:AAA ATPase domain